MTDYGRYNMNLEECRKCLHKIYSFLRGSLPDRKGIEEEDMPKVQELLNGIPGKFKTLHEKIPQNESDGTIIVPEDLEMIRTTLDGIVEAEVEILCISKVLDAVRPELGTMPKGDE
jgi:hypothetical protein